MLRIVFIWFSAYLKILHYQFINHFTFSYQQELEEKKVESDDDESDYDDESDDEFNIKVGEVYDRNELPELELISTLDEDRSTHFIAIKVTNADIIERAVEIQQNIIEKEEVSLKFLLSMYIKYVNIFVYN